MEKHVFYDYGNGVYYVRACQEKFAKCLSEFIGEHPELRLVSMCGDANLFECYFVVFEKRQ
jgi:hypothetical protein